MDKEKLIEINKLLNLLSLHGGEIVCTASLDTNDINQARASGRMSVTENNIGYVWIPDIRKFPETDEEVQFFEKWYPLDVEFPEKFLSPDYVKENIIDKVGKETSLISKLKNLKSDFDSYPDPKTSEGTIWLNYDELNRILTSLTAPVPDGEEESIKCPYCNDGYTSEHTNHRPEEPCIECPIAVPCGYCYGSGRVTTKLMKEHIVESSRNVNDDGLPF